MDQLTLKPRKAVVEVPIENWDDDDLDIGGDDFTFRSASLATTAATNFRDSVSSRLSLQSDRDSNFGDEEKQVHVPGNDEISTNDAIAQAKRAGIPIPQNVPTSALLGGTIKRLGGRRIQRIIRDDWDDGDLELPGEGGLHLKKQDGADFPDALRQVSAGSVQSSPVKRLQAAPAFTLGQRHELKPKTASSNLLLDSYRDQDDDDFFGDGGDTIKVSKSRQVPKLLPLITPPTPQRNDKPINRHDDFEHDFQFPADDKSLRLSVKKDIPRTPNSGHDEFDEWAEGGSLGTRYGGTRRDARSNRSSSASALSPSVASSITAESEDEGLDGLVLPPGPIHFDDILKKRQQDRSPDPHSVEKQAAKRAEVKDDFLTGLEIGDGDVFDSKKLTLNRNIKVKATRQASPTRPKTAVSITFTNKPGTSTVGVSRLPRPLAGHERSGSCLEPVSESGGPIMSRNSRRSQSRLGGHSAQSSVTSVQTPTTPSSGSSIPPSTPRRRDLASKTSTGGLRNEPTTTSAQLLKLKRSMPTMSSMRTYPQSPAKALLSRYERPPSRNDNSRPNSIARAKSPVRSESSMGTHARKPIPFLPAGVSGSQSQHIASKSSRHFRRHDSESSNNSAEFRPTSRAMSRATMRSPSPRRHLRGAEALAREAASKRQITQPTRRRHYGDGFELDGFDDLPTSKEVEQRMMKEPSRGPSKVASLRHKPHMDSLSSTRTTTPAPSTPLLMQHHAATRSREELPRFARDTNASRMAREYSLAQRTPSNSGAPLAALTNQWKAKVSATTGLSAIHAQPVKPKKIKGPPKKPQLIKPLGSINNAKSVKGMVYNPYKFRWEGNENDLSPFDAPAFASSPSTTDPFRPAFAKEEPQIYREKENTTPRPALIQNVNSSMNVQVVGGMVFDPARMCWLKMPSAASRNSKSHKSSDAGDTMDGFDGLGFDLDESNVSEEEDVFKDVPDLVDKDKEGGEGVEGRERGSGVGLKDDWLVGEEFDVGPQFIKNQREEEVRWRRKTEKWVGDGLVRGGEEWRWSIRGVVREL